MKRVIVLCAFAAACASGGAPAAGSVAAPVAAGVESSDQAYEPCSVPVPPNTGDWRKVEATVVTFCVPVSWRVSATQARTTGNTIRWGTSLPRQQVVVSGGPGRMSTTSIANSGASSSGTTMARRITSNEMIGGQMGDIYYEEGTGRVGTGISFTRPTFSMTGEASGQENVELQLAIYRTIRFNQ